MKSEVVHIDNGTIRAVIHHKGAELQSLYNSDTGLEYIWEGDPAYWTGRSPVLFPIVGALINGEYSFNGKKYQLPRHGFARNRIFEVEHLTNDSVVFVLRADDFTLQKYPFLFELKITYQLKKDTCVCTCAVSNTSTEDQMWFSIGAHPAFRVPMTSGTKYSNYYLHFQRDLKLSFRRLKDGLIANKRHEIPLPDGMLPLQHRLFYDDALILDPFHSDLITLSSSQHDHGLEFSWEGYSHFGIWAARDAPFVCLEPWCGIADTIDHNGSLQHKEGIICLQGKENRKVEWNVRVF